MEPLELLAAVAIGYAAAFAWGVYVGRSASREREHEHRDKAARVVRRLAG